MEIIGCTCNWDIPGVTSLPTHHHYDRYEFDKHPVAGVVIPYILIPDIKIWVPWKEIAKAFDKMLQEMR